ncbi:MAG: acyltransferase family protein [Alphaproteobacteria bacterium]|nr:acyltransferase family protein [Alphaproteobacteria bacterium]
MPLSPAIARALARTRLSPEDRALLDDLRFYDAGHGYDPFGLHPAYVALGLALLRPIYDHYFRVLSFGAEHIPHEGPAILAGNHSGTLPFDAMMLWIDVLLHTRRVVRSVADHFVPTLPILGTLFHRSGAVGGSRGNVRKLLENGELMAIFPEGTVGIGKGFDKRYQLERFRVGHAELSIRHRAPVVPVGFVGAEEQMPQLTKLVGLGRVMGLPYVPVPATPIPLPVRYRIHYGPPIPLHEQYPPDAADDPDAVREAAARVQQAVQDLLQQGLRIRKGRLFT